MRTMKAKMAALILAVVMALGLAGCGVDISNIGLPSDLVLEKGESQLLEIQYGTENDVSTAEVAKAVEKLTLTWTSSDESVVTVDDTGMVTAVGAGEADVTVTAEKLNLSSTTHVKVVILPEGLSAPESMTLELNGENTKALGAVMTPEDATEVKLAYASSDESIAMVDEDGMVTAVGVGGCTITTTIVADVPATAETSEAAVDSEMLVAPDGFTAVTKVTVTKRMESITFDNSEGVLNVGNTHTIKATVAPADASDQALNWTSSDPNVATVDSNGKVTAKAEGSATITASNAGGDVSASYDLTVKKVTCSYCGQTGHTSSGCPVKAADQKAAQQAAAAAQAAQQQAAQSSGSGGSASGSTSAPSAPSNPDPAPAPDPAPSGGGSSGGDSGSSGGDGGSSGSGGGQGIGSDWGNQVVTGGGNGTGPGNVTDW